MKHASRQNFVLKVQSSLKWFSFKKNLCISCENVQLHSYLQVFTGEQGEVNGGMTSCAAHRLQVCGGLEETLWHRRPPSYSLSWSALHEVLHHKFNLISAFRRAAMILWGHVTPVCRTCKYMSWCTCIYYNDWNAGNWHLTFWLTCWPSKVCWCQSCDIISVRDAHVDNNMDT